ncbi:MAG TPA: prepilin-type N-terminal cleavage/methylation domain-containing protein [Oligoflexus sp.]|uniref:prepilin-type N-terminal cleavage/methylation domain-containing protein n=1 Tax=Oligoflexus sp. TaxID=1971216 RepID=UPI002D7F53EA|nr:prepilin-type N-terminal cleavage/methylation domain-containing protein [Oligoflexus sp.]HET9240963.1 prepilin-type N-terminal cleavage/methylation domain-containing protein [Oligoflexus sp.]
MKFTSFKNQKGFSLVELMIVVGIIGILATLALPRFKQFQAKAKMGEAKNILSHIFTLQQTYSLDNNQYRTVEPLGAGLGSPNQGNTCIPTVGGGAELIGFRLDPCQNNAPVPRYQYSVPTATASAFIAQAITGAALNNRVCPGNLAHHYAINQTNVVYGGTGTTPITIQNQNTNAPEPSVGAVCPN